MIPIARVVAIDDEKKHLEGISKGLNSLGVGCLQIHFTGSTVEVGPCPQARIIFADLHLTGGGPGTDNKKHFGVLAGLIEETLRPSGLYVLILWTNYPDQAEALRAYLEASLERSKRPFAVIPLDKNDHLDGQGDIKDVANLVAAIQAIAANRPQLAALLNWEERVFGAAAATVAEIVDIALGSQPNSANHSEAMATLLAMLGKEVVGQDNLKDPSNRFPAINEALLPILADRIGNLQNIDADKELWREAFAEKQIIAQREPMVAAKLNRLMHFADSSEALHGAQRGAVIPLPDNYVSKFEEVFGINEEKAKAQFRTSTVKSPSRWVLIQGQAICDSVQNQPGPLPFYVGIEVPFELASKVKLEALWRSPTFLHDGVQKIIHMNARFHMSFTVATARAMKPFYRLREQALTDLLFHAHTYGARPGKFSL